SLFLVAVGDPIFGRVLEPCASPQPLLCPQCRRTPNRTRRVLLRVPHRARSSVASQGLLRQECCYLACAIEMGGRRLTPGSEPALLARHTSCSTKGLAPRATMCHPRAVGHFKL
ncbi:hypothetical protein HAX54_044082, partial [Datura stramonium]|nr:hypothetical protein [Datura stramonium]